MDEWIQHTMNFQTFNYDDESWVGEEISKVMRGHQPTKYFNCDKFGHLKRDCRQGISRNNTSSGNGRNRKPRSSGMYRTCVLPHPIYRKTLDQ